MFCNDKKDNDLDGKIDCGDPDCASYQGCNEQFTTGDMAAINVIFTGISDGLMKGNKNIENTKKEMEKEGEWLTVHELRKLGYYMSTFAGMVESAKDGANEGKMSPEKLKSILTEMRYLLKKLELLSVQAKEKVELSRVQAKEKEQKKIIEKTFK